MISPIFQEAQYHLSRPSRSTDPVDPVGCKIAINSVAEVLVNFGQLWSTCESHQRFKVIQSGKIWKLHWKCHWIRALTDLWTYGIADLLLGMVCCVWELHQMSGPAMAVGFGAPSQLRCGLDVVGWVDLVCNWWCLAEAWCRWPESRLLMHATWRQQRCNVGKGNFMEWSPLSSGFDFQNFEPRKGVNMWPLSPRGLEVVSRSCRPKHWAAAVGTAGLLEMEEMQQTVAMELRPDFCRCCGYVWLLVLML